jgi:hypothetical protein
MKKVLARKFFLKFFLRAWSAARDAERDLRMCAARRRVQRV